MAFPIVAAGVLVILSGTIVTSAFLLRYTIEDAKEIVQDISEDTGLSVGFGGFGIAAAIGAGAIVYYMVSK